MKKLEKKPSTDQVEYIEDQKFPGYYGSVWGEDKKKIMLIRNNDMQTQHAEDMYQWLTADLCFIHIGRFETVKKALIRNNTDIYKFDSLVELASWMST